MFITPNWPAPKQIKALCTTREGGVSTASFDSFNLALHVGDEVQCVEENRRRLVAQAKLPSSPFWLDQQHTDVAIKLSKNSLNTYTLNNLPPPVADASWTTEKGCVSVVMTADCLPLLITNQQGTLVCAIHAGWKGLQQGIVQKTILEFSSQVNGCSPQELLVWIGPAIQQNYFEVGKDVLDLFVANDPLNKDFFIPLPKKRGGELQKYQADLIGLVIKELNALGITAILGGDLCSYAQKDLFYSYRRSGQTGRMASLIWIE
ncbi:MAG TPA: peptidoglycan editing factor PgeF [Thiomicrorhabdus sp.]|nr:peptidoglycan editing factor PgeF [Thiomicrorhabdus sp.]